jgi:hypothetical protein
MTYMDDLSHMAVEQVHVMFWELVGRDLFCCTVCVAGFSLLNGTCWQHRVHTYIHTYIAYIHTYKHTIHTLHLYIACIHTLHTYIHYITYIRTLHTYLHTYTHTNTHTHTHQHTHYPFNRPALGPSQIPVRWVSGSLSVGVKRSEREADHWLPYTADIKNEWSCNTGKPYIFRAQWLTA